MEGSRKYLFDHHARGLFDRAGTNTTLRMLACNSVQRSTILKELTVKATFEKSGDGYRLKKQSHSDPTEI